MDAGTPEDFMRLYERAANSRDFSNLIPLIHEDSEYWFSDGSFRGIHEVRKAFESTWRTVEDEEYSIHDLRWIVISDDCAVCIYLFTSRGRINGKYMEINGRGTNVIRRFAGIWKIVHEHLSTLWRGQIY